MRDRQPKHRQMRAEQRALARRKESRAGLPVILVVCEGRKTEPHYIRGLCEAKRINLANVTLISGDHETDAISLVRKAQAHLKADNDYDAVFVVCDDDGAPLDSARRQAQVRIKNAAGKRLSVEIITSRPCFEFWLLLHFEYTARMYTNTSDVIRDLRRHLPDYEKSDRLIFPKVGAGLDLARGRALQLKRDLRSSGATSPDTQVAQLVEQLLSMSRNAHCTQNMHAR
jgi:hypothetical protein